MKMFQWLCITLSLLGIAAHAQARPIHKIDAYGIYAVAKNGYVRVVPYNHINNFVDFKYLDEIPSVIRGSEQVKFIVYTNHFKTGNYRFETRPLQTTLTITAVSFNARPLKDRGMYELTLDKKVQDGNMLHVYAPEFFGHRMGAVVLGDTQKDLVRYFSDKKQRDAYAMRTYLEDAIKAYPENKALNDLYPYWRHAAREEKDRKDYSGIDENWHKYKQADKPYLKVSYLRSMLGDINSYLRDHPHGKKAKVARQRKEFAEKKIREYEPLL